MAAGWPTKADYATGDVLSATNMNDLSGTVNLINPSAKGDLYAGSAANTYTKLSVGANATVLTADSTTATGLKWATPAASTPTFVGAKVFNTSSQSISNNTYTAATYTSESYDTDGFHDNSTNTSRLTIPTGKGGKYLINALVYWLSSDNSGARTILLYKNGSAVLTREWSISTRGNLDMSFTSMQSAVATDYFECYVYQTSGGSLTLDKTEAQAEFSISYLGA